MDRVSRREVMRSAFAARFGRDPSHWVRAPGRVDAMGSHTDYNDGFVLTLSIDRDTWIGAAPRCDGRVRIASLNLDDEGAFEIAHPLERPNEGWPLYFQGVAALLAREGHPLVGCDALVHGTIPIASGLSSSASLEAAAAVLFASLADLELERVAMARLCQRAENEIVGVACGILDQYSSILGEEGSALLLDCRHLTHTYAQIPESLRPVICNTRARRELAASEYGARRASCEAGARALAARLPRVTALRDVDLPSFDAYEAELDAVTARRCRFVIEENSRVHALARCLEQDDHDSIGVLCADSFAGARYQFEISTPEMDAMYAAMTASPGVVGARQAGAGFGGCMLALVEVDAVEAFVEATASSYERATGKRPEIAPVASAAGAGPLAPERVD